MGGFKGLFLSFSFLLSYELEGLWTWMVGGRLVGRCNLGVFTFPWGRGLSSSIIIIISRVARERYKLRKHENSRELGTGLGWGKGGRGGGWRR